MELCRHCEKKPKATYLGLCETCSSTKGIPLLYRKKPGWTQEEEDNIQRLVERAKLKLPLFPTAEERINEEIKRCG